MYRGILELKNDTSILYKNGSFIYKTCCTLTGLFVKTKIYFCYYNSGNKQIKIPSIFFSYRLWSIGRAQTIPENVCSFGNGTPKTWAPTKNKIYH